MLLEAVTAYGDVVRDTAIVRLRENNVTVLTRDLRATQDRFNVGEVTRTDVAQAQARRAAAVAALDLARANLKTSRATFERVIGHPPSNLVEARASQPGAEDRAGERRDLRAREPERGGGALPRAGRALRHRPDPRRAAADRAARGQLHQALRPLDRHRRDGDHAGHGPGDGAVLHRRRGAGARAAGQAHAHPAPAGDRAGAHRGAGAGGDGLVAAGGGRGGGRVRHHRRRMPTASRSPACARRSGSASARCSTCSTPSRSCSTPRSTWSPTSATCWWPPMRVLSTIGRLNCAGAGRRRRWSTIPRRTTTTCAASGSTSPSPIGDGRREVAGGRAAPAVPPVK